jgi:hypothetical protein
VSWCVDNPGSLPSLNDSAIGALADCVAETDCAEFSLEGVFDACLPQARREVRPSKYVSTFCEEYATAWFECGGFYSVEQCVRDFKLWSDETLADASECRGEQSCDLFESCLDVVFGAA